jgi:hypothetical protein
VRTQLDWDEPELDEARCRGCGLPASWCQCGPDIDRFPEEPHVQSDEQLIIAVASHMAGDEPWHLEPPTPDTKEEDWAHLARECKEFIDKYGYSAFMRCAGEAMKP